MNLISIQALNCVSIYLIILHQIEDLWFKKLFFFRDILGSEHYQFDGNFEDGCQESSIPHTLSLFISYVLHGSSATPGNNEYYKQAMLSVCQLITFNTLIRTRKDSSSSYHSILREPALCVYLAMMIHNKTRSLELIETLSKLGLCISKHRLSNLSISMGNTLIEANERDGVVIPMNLKKGVFSTASVDNIDVDTKATLSTTSLHGTAASLNQHPTTPNEGQSREKNSLNQRNDKLKNLPTWYIEVKPFHLPNDITMPTCEKPVSSIQVDESVLLEDKSWLRGPSQSSWAVFHSRSREHPVCNDTSAMIPILRDDSKSPATIKHFINVLIQSIDFLNPRQTAVIGFDQPLYALAKRIQWNQPMLYGQEKLVVMLGALHIEMVMLSCIGDWLQDSGWTIALSNSGVTSSGNDSLLTGHDVANTKYAHQVTALTLYNLMNDAFEKSGLNNGVNFEAWRAEMEIKSPQFQFWSIALKIEMDYLMFLRSIRSSNFNLYISSIGKFLPWIFAFDHVHYSRWLSIHHYDMEMLKDTNPEIHHEFDVNGNFTVKRTRNRFSKMGLDQRHEQLNKDVKGISKNDQKYIINFYFNSKRRRCFSKKFPKAC